MDFIEEADTATFTKGESTPIFDEELFYTEKENEYTKLAVPRASGTKQLVFSATFNDPTTKEDFKVEGKFKEYTWAGKLLTKPIVIESWKYPARCKYSETENFINKNTYDINIPKTIFRYDENNQVIKEEILKDRRYAVNLPEFCDFSKVYQDKAPKDFKNVAPLKTYYFVFPVVILEDNAPKIVFFSQPITSKLLYDFKDKGYLEKPSIKGCAKYLFGSLDGASIGDNVLFFNHPGLEFKQKTHPWFGCTWKFMFNKLDQVYQDKYFNFDFEAIRSQITDEYISFLAAKFLAGNMRDKKGNGKIYTDENKLDPEKSSINSITDTILSSLIYGELEKINQSETPKNPIEENSSPHPQDDSVLEDTSLI